jgi:hypothetical protein
VVSLLALFVALGSSSMAAPARDAAKKLITGAQIKNSTITTHDIRNRSLLKVDFKAGQLPAGPKGDPGVQGPKGDQGSKGDTGIVGQTVTVIADTGAIGPGGGEGSATADCPTGYQVLGGGVDPANLLKLVVTQSSPLLREAGLLGGRPTGESDGQHGVANAWTITVLNNDTSSHNAKVTAICAQQ